MSKSLVLQAAERRNLRSPMREHWDSGSLGEEPRSGGICAGELGAMRTVNMSESRRPGDVAAPRLPIMRFSIPNAHALGYVDGAAPRLCHASRVAGQARLLGVQIEAERPTLDQ